MKTSHVILAVVGGAVVGAAIALLLAPKSGEETREDIKRFVEKETDKIGKRVTKLKESLQPKAENQPQEV